MARAPAEQKTADEIIGQLDGLDASNLSRIIEAASGLRSTKQAAERDAFIARVREEAAAIGLRPEELFAPALSAPRKAAGSTPKKRGMGAVPVKYRSPDGKNEWSGRGKTPGWVLALEESGLTRDKLVAGGQPDLIEQAKAEHGAS
jgi:DNA-binding protein H-NS